MHSRAYNMCELVVRWADLFPSTFPIVYTTILKGLSTINWIPNFPDWDSVPNAHYWSIKSSKKVSPPRPRDKTIGLALLNKPIRKYINSISMGRVWTPTTKGFFSRSHMSMMYSSRKTYAFILVFWKYFKSLQFCRASTVVGSLMAWKSGASCSHCFQITMVKMM